MAGKIQYLKQNDVLPILDVILRNPDGTVHDLTGSSAWKLLIQMPDGNKLIRTMTKVGADIDGHLRYVWVMTDWEAASAADANGNYTVGGLVVGPGRILANGTYLLGPKDVEPFLEYEVRPGPLTFPNDGMDILRCPPHVGDAP
jgi:hypothetical protein